MKVARFVLKIVSACLAVAAITCCVIAYWDKIVDCVEAVSDRLGYNRKGHLADSDDYADWED